MGDWSVSVRVVMDVVPMAVGMRVNDFGLVVTRGGSGYRAQEAGYIHQSQDDQHYRDAQLHAESEPDGNDEIEEYDASPHHKNGNGVANSPKSSDQRGPHTVALIADDGCHRNNVVGVGGMAHPQKKSHRENREKADHAFRRVCLD